MKGRVLLTRNVTWGAARPDVKFEGGMSLFLHTFSICFWGWTVGSGQLTDCRRGAEGHSVVMKKGANDFARTVGEGTVAQRNKQVQSAAQDAQAASFS